ncbi:hypothetical protein BRI6_1095 [plant metagenome]|uniref:Regulatory protein GemA n=1 Tax=plant metagenome TaxID=1297885 RepID=A0A484XJF0_9ZZZZ
MSTAAPTTPRRPARDRRADLAAIHIAEKALQMDQEEARDLKLQVTGKSSSADMTARERRRYLVHLHQVQRAREPGRGKPYTAQRAPLQRSPDDAHDDRWSKARAMWSALARAGQVRTDTDSALLAYVKRQTGVEAWRWLNGYQINTVIEALKKWSLRAGIEV